MAGLTSIFSRIFTGWFSDLNFVDSFMVYTSYIFLMGVTVILLPFCNSFALFAVVASFYGFFTAFYILESIVLVELLGLDKLTSAAGQGVLYLIHAS